MDRHNFQIRVDIAGSASTRVVHVRVHDRDALAVKSISMVRSKRNATCRVLVRDNNVDQALKVLKKKMQQRLNKPSCPQPRDDGDRCCPACRGLSLTTSMSSEYRGQAVIHHHWQCRSCGHEWITVAPTRFELQGRADPFGVVCTEPRFDSLAANARIVKP